MTALDALAERVAAGEALTEADAQVVLGTQDLIAVGMLADEVRRRLHGMRTTFVRVFEVHVDAVPAALVGRLDAGEIRVTGTPASLGQAVDAVRAVKRLNLRAPVCGFALDELHTLVTESSFRELCADLHAAGLDGISEVPVDALEHAAAAILSARDAGLSVQRLSIRRVAHGSPVASIVRARDIQTAVGGFSAFAPLPRDVPPAAPTTGYDDVKHVALARLMIPTMPSIQVDWIGHGPKLAQVALTMGADDIDRVSAEWPGTLGTRRSPLEEVRGNIRAAALEPSERDGRFQPRTDQREQTAS